MIFRNLESFDTRIHPTKMEPHARLIRVMLTLKILKHNSQYRSFWDPEIEDEFEMWIGWVD